MKKKIIKAPDFLADKSGVLEFRLWRFVERHPKMKTAIENVLFQNGVRNVEVDYEDKKNLIRLLIFDGEIKAVEIGYPEEEWSLKKES